MQTFGVVFVDACGPGWSLEITAGPVQDELITSVPQAVLSVSFFFIYYQATRLCAVVKSRRVMKEKRCC